MVGVRVGVPVGVAVQVGRNAGVPVAVGGGVGVWVEVGTGLLGEIGVIPGKGVTVGGSVGGGKGLSAESGLRNTHTPQQNTPPVAARKKKARVSHNADAHEPDRLRALLRAMRNSLHRNFQR